MKRGTVITVLPNRDKTLMFYADAANPVLEALGARAADFDTLWRRPLSENAVEAAGRQLYASLTRSPEVAGALASVLGRGQDEGDFPILLKLESPDAESLPWEALWSDRFLALERWPVARLAAPARGPLKIRKVMSGELRVTLVIAAGGLEEVYEWQELSNVLEGLQALRPPARLQVILSDHALKRRIEAIGDGRIHIEFLEARGDFLEPNVRAFAPNILHFFCHGAAEPAPHLALATQSDRQPGGNRDGSFKVEARELTWTGSLETLWLVILNCCQGAKPSGALRSLGRDLVESGVPVAVAMREMVDVADAHAFSRAFYEELARVIQPMLGGVAGNGGPAVVTVTAEEWARMLCPTRCRILDARRKDRTLSQAAANCTEWIFPLLYVHRSPLELEIKAARKLSEAEESNLRAQLAKLSELRVTLGNEATPLRDEVDRRMTQIRTQLYEA